MIFYANFWDKLLGVFLLWFDENQSSVSFCNHQVTILTWFTCEYLFIKIATEWIMMGINSESPLFFLIQLLLFPLCLLSGSAAQDITESSLFLHFFQKHVSCFCFFIAYNEYRIVENCRDVTSIECSYEYPAPLVIVVINSVCRLCFR